MLYFPGRTALPLLLAARDSGWLRPFMTMITASSISSVMVYTLVCALCKARPSRQANNVIALQTASLLLTKSNNYSTSFLRVVVMISCSHPTWFAILMASSPDAGYSSAIYIAISILVRAGESAIVSGNSECVIQSLLARSSLYDSPRLDVVLAIKYFKLVVVLTACMYGLLKINNQGIL